MVSCRDVMWHHDVTPWRHMASWRHGRRHTQKSLIKFIHLSLLSFFLWSVQARRWVYYGRRNLIFINRDAGEIFHLSHGMGKSASTSLLLSYQKKDWCVGPRHSFFWYDDRLQYIICGGSRVQFYSRCYIQRRIGWASSANLSLGMTMTKILRHIFPWHSSFGSVRPSVCPSICL